MHVSVIYLGWNTLIETKQECNWALSLSLSRFFLRFSFHSIWPSPSKRKIRNIWYNEANCDRTTTAPIGRVLKLNCHLFFTEVLYMHDVLMRIFKNEMSDSSLINASFESKRYYSILLGSFRCYANHWVARREDLREAINNSRDVLYSDAFIYFFLCTGVGGGGWRLADLWS